MSNLLAQRKEIKRLEKEEERRRREEDENQRERGEEEKGRAVVEFEKVMMGLEGGEKREKKGDGSVVTKEKEVEEEKEEARGVKRKFELDEEEILKNARAERAKARKALDEEKVCSITILSLDFCVSNVVSRKGRKTYVTLFLGPVTYTFI